MAQRILLPLTVCFFSKIEIGFTFLVLAHPGSPGQRAIKRVCVLDEFCIKSGVEVCNFILWTGGYISGMFDPRIEGFMSLLVVISSIEPKLVIQEKFLQLTFIGQECRLQCIFIAAAGVLVPSVLWRCWLGGRKGNWVVGCWRGYLPGARCRLAYSPADATATHCLLLQ